MNLSLSSTQLNDNKIHQGIACIALSVVIAIAAQISVPMYPVPVTLQTLAVILIAMIAGPAVAVGAVVAYLIEGAMGFPVFSHFAGGLQHLMGPTGGYLFGFIGMAVVAGMGAKKGFCNTFVGAFLTSIAATAFAVACGVIVLAQFVGWSSVVVMGVTPFVLGAILKSVFAATVVFRLN